MLSPYRRVLSTPGALLFSLTGIIARLPISMVSLGIVLLVESRSDSYGLAGAVAAVYILSNASLAIVHGRLIDSYGQTRVLPVVITIFGTGLALFMFAVLADLPRWCVYSTVALTGASLPQVGACVRARWSHAVTDDADIQTAYAYESVADEAVFILGPVLVTLLATTLHPASGLTTALVAGVLGTLALAAQRRTAPPAHLHHNEGNDKAPMPWLVVGTVTAVFLALGSLFGATEVATIAFAEDRDALRYAGFFLGLWSLGSLLSGIAVGAVSWRSGPIQRMRWGALLLALALVPVPFVTSLPVMAVALFLAGFAISPTLIGATSLIERSVPTSRLSEGLAVAHTGIAAGLAPGAAIAGLVVDTYGASAAYFVAIASGVVGVTAAWFTGLRSHSTT